MSLWVFMWVGGLVCSIIVVFSLFDFDLMYITVLSVREVEISISRREPPKGINKVPLLISIYLSIYLSITKQSKAVNTTESNSVKSSIKQFCGGLYMVI